MNLSLAMRFFSCHGDRKARGRFLLQSKVTRRGHFSASNRDLALRIKWG